MKATECLYRLLDYATEKGLIEAIDRPYYLNRLLEIMGMEEPEKITYTPEEAPETATRYLEPLCDRAVSNGWAKDTEDSRFLFSSKLMGALTPSPAEVRRVFFEKYASDPQEATKYFYNLCRDVDYIRVDKIKKNIRYFPDTDCGKLEITINLTKPEKDPKAIAAALNQKAGGYPQCHLCIENPGYAGRDETPETKGFTPRQHHRVIPLTLGGIRCYMQYSPYLYFDEHCIVFNEEHTPMKLTRDSFVRLCDFVDQFPHYMLGSNADLPIVGGSILTHDHFQGGNYRFPMDDAKPRITLTAPVDGVEAYVADWPMTCVVLKSTDREKIIDLSDKLLAAWREWTDEKSEILAYSGTTPHNTVTPIMRKGNGVYKMELVLRNNRTTEEHPLGLFHPHKEKHHIKKENIGLIEVMGLFILPGRLKTEMVGMKNWLTGKTALVRPEETDRMAQHFDFVSGIAAKTGTNLTEEEAEKVIRQEIANVCAGVLADAGVYKQTEEGDAGLKRFLESIGYCCAEVVK